MNKLHAQRLQLVIISSFGFSNFHHYYSQFTEGPPVSGEPIFLFRQHFLNLRPDPQGQGSFRPG
jgi:hypothetical protein